MDAILGLLLLLSISLVFAACIHDANSKRKSFEERFPPLSDADFVERCGPGTNAAVALKVRRLLSDCLGVDYERIHPSARLIQDLGAE